MEILSSSEYCPSDVVCFHCQQYVEKLLKAFLTVHGIETPRTHDLRRLIQLAQAHMPELTQMSESADSLTVYGVETRYPGDLSIIELEEMNRVLELAKAFGELLRPYLSQFKN